MTREGKEFVAPTPTQTSELDTSTPATSAADQNGGGVAALSGCALDQEVSQSVVDSIARCARGLFGAHLALSVRRTSGCNLDLLPCIERQAISNAGPKRRNEFFAGRIAAKEALGQLGIERAVIPMCADRAPKWPSGVIGSIAHSTGIAIAVAGRTSDCNAIGIDIEGAGGLSEDVWPEIFLPTELDWLSTLPPPVRARSAMIMFCAKESFYKFQYPMTHAWLGFLEAQVTIHQSACRFTVSSPRTAHLLPQSQGCFYGGYGLTGDYTISGLAI